jgi:hypothetical protein
MASEPLSAEVADAAEKTMNKDFWAKKTWILIPFLSLNNLIYLCNLPAPSVYEPAASDYECIARIQAVDPRVQGVDEIL